MAHNFKDKNIGVGITGSYCTYKKVFEELRRLADTQANLFTIFSDNASSTDSRFGKCKDFLKLAEEISGKPPITTIPDAEPIGPKSMLDLLIIAPCTGNSAAKLANAITDTPVLMAAKAHMRNGKPLVIAISTNDALGASFKNIGMLMNTKHIYFVPFAQDNYEKKPNSMVAKMELLPETISAALEGKQLQPVVRG